MVAAQGTAAGRRDEHQMMLGSTRGLALAVAGICFVVFLLTATFGPPTSIDTQAAALPAWSLAHHGTLDLTGVDKGNPWVVAVGGHQRSNRFPGAVLIAVPFYAVLGADRFSPAPAAVAAATSTAATCTLMLLVLLRIVRRRTALLATGLFAFGTATWSVSADQLWQHTVTQPALTASLLALSSRRWWAAGFGYAVAVLARPHTAVVAFVVGLWQSIVERSVGPALRIGLATTTGFLVLAGYQRANYGRWTLLGTYGANATGAGDTITQQPGSLAVKAAGILLSPERGLLIYAPFVLVLLFGVPAAWRIAPAWVRSSAIGGLVYLGVQLASNTFTGGTAFFGSRLTLETLTLAAPLLAIAGERFVTTTGRAVALAVTAVWSVSVTALGAVTYGADSLADRPWSTWILVDALHVDSPSAQVFAGLLAFGLVAGWLLMVRRLADAPPEHALS